MTLKIASFDLRQLRRAGRSQDGEAASGSLHRWLNRICIRCRAHGLPLRGLTRHSDPIRAEKRNPAESIAELREIANGHDDILAEAAGIRPLVLRQAQLPVSGMGDSCGMLILAGGGAG